MKRLLAIIVVALLLAKCKPAKEYLTFEDLDPSAFNAGHFALPGGKVIDSAKQSHDSCMGISFAANALLLGKKDSLFVGSIVNRQTLQEVGSLKELGFDFLKLAGSFNIVTNPCYERKEIHLPLKIAFGNSAINLPGADAAINKEINDIIQASSNQDLQTGSWMYLDMNQVIVNMMDTIKTPAGLAYREKLLDSSNMFLSAVESVGSVSFMVQASKPMSPALVAKLAEKPVVPLQGLQNPLRLFLIAPDKFEISADGIFPVIGKFMKAVIKKG